MVGVSPDVIAMVVKLAVMPMLMCSRNKGKKLTNSLSSVASVPIFTSLIAHCCPSGTFTRNLYLGSQNPGYPPAR